MTNKTIKTLIVILGISLLALSSVVAWPFSQKDESKAVVPLAQTLQSTQEMPSSQEVKTEQPKLSEDSATISNSEDVVCIPKDELVDIVAELETGTTEMSDGHEMVSAAAVDYERKYIELMKPKYFVKAVADWDIGQMFGVGVGGGVIFSQKYMFDLSIVKKDIMDLTSYGNLNGYRVTFSVGYVF